MSQRFLAAPLALLACMTTVLEAAQPPEDRAPLVEAIWSGAPEDFEVTSHFNEWVWDDAVGVLDPTAVLNVKLSIRLPRDWVLKSFRSGKAKLLEVKKRDNQPGHWDLVLETDLARADAFVEFADARNRAQKLELTLKSRSRHPFVLEKLLCENFKVELEPGIEQASYLYLGISCYELGDDVILHFVRSADARWVSSKVIKKPAATAFEHRLPKPRGRERHAFNLATEDQQRRRAEYAVYVTPRRGD